MLRDFNTFEETHGLGNEAIKIVKLFRHSIIETSMDEIRKDGKSIKSTVLI